MKFAMSLETQGTKVDPRTTMNLAYGLLTAIADLLRMSKQLNCHKFLPTIASDCATLAGEIDHASDFFNSTNDAFTQLSRASALLNAAENLLKTSLCDRLIRPEARLPISVVHAPKVHESLEYDHEMDVIRCQCPDWSDVIATNMKMLKALSSISANDLIPSLKVDGAAVSLPEVSPTLFSHSQGAGRRITSTCKVSGVYLVAHQVEVRIEGFRDDRIVHAQLGDAARIAASTRHPPFTAAIQYSETAPLLPLLPLAKGQVTIESIWDIEEQPGLDLA